jgi:PAS domain S-box-containing protein
MYDITESRKTEEKLRESEDKFRTLFKLYPVGMAMIDYEIGVFQKVNNAVLKPIVYTKEEFLTLNFRDITPKN